MLLKHASTNVYTGDMQYRFVDPSMALVVPCWLKTPVTFLGFVAALVKLVAMDGSLTTTLDSWHQTTALLVPPTTILAAIKYRLLPILTILGRTYGVV